MKSKFFVILVAALAAVFSTVLTDQLLDLGTSLSWSFQSVFLVTFFVAPPWLALGILASILFQRRD